MQPFEFIKSELNSFIKNFPKTRVRYENDTYSNTHSIEVVPNDIYRLDKDYIAWEEHFFDNFITIFPDQNICFISDDAIVGLDKVDFELFGKEFESHGQIIIPTSSNKISTNICIHIKSANKEQTGTINNVRPTASQNVKTETVYPITFIENIVNYNYLLAA